MLIADWIERQSRYTYHSSPRDLRQLICHVLQVNSAWLMAHTDASLNPAQLEQLERLSSQLSAGVPLNQLTGKCAFWNIELQVNKHTLIPRPDTETLIETIVDLDIQPTAILDLGTGSGAIALVLARLFPDARVVATDLSPQALNMAECNRQNLQVDHLELIQSDWFKELPAEPFDLIVSNPPYIAADDPHMQQLSHEPRQALVAENDGLAAYQAICEHAGEYLVPGGWLVFEHGWQQQQPVTNIMHQAGFIEVSTRSDLQGHPRVTYGQWPG
jgi:release factor glutamine methyltransferase